MKFVGKQGRYVRAVAFSHLCIRNRYIYKYKIFNCLLRNKNDLQIVIYTCVIFTALRAYIHDCPIKQYKKLSSSTMHTFDIVFICTKIIKFSTSSYLSLELTCFSYSIPAWALSKHNINIHTQYPLSLSCSAIVPLRLSPSFVSSVSHLYKY